MKLLGINGSPHKDGNTCTLISEVFRGASGNGHQFELVHLINLNLDYCNWCGHCTDKTPGVCRIDDGLMDNIRQIFEADVLVVGTPSSTRSVTGYMKNWLDRFVNSQLIFDAEDGNVRMESRVPEGKRAVIIVQGCTDKMQETIEPINVVMDALKIDVLDRLVATGVGLTDEDTIDKRPEIMSKAYQIGRALK